MGDIEMVFGKKEPGTIEIEVEVEVVEQEDRTVEIEVEDVEQDKALILVEPFREARESYRPQRKAREWLSKAMGYINSVDYKVSARWVSYRLLQDGTLSSKKDFGKLEHYLNQARKGYYEDWTPFTLADSIRETLNVPILDHGAESYDPEAMAEENLEGLDYFYVDIPRWHYEQFYVEVWFEARAMSEQFQQYVPKNVALQPCGGDLSIPLKAEGAKRLRRWAEEIGKPPVVLYFGDYDTKGLQIPSSIGTELYSWCCPELKIYRIGLLEEHIERFGLPENPEKPGDYQWEALSDEQAQEIITEGLNEFLTDEAIRKVHRVEQRIIAEAKVKLQEKLESYLEDHNE